MAKKTDFNLDDIGFDSELGFDTPDFDLADPPDDRTPSTKAIHGAAKGFKDTVFSNDFVLRFLKKVMPKGYGQAMDLAGDAAGNLRNLYHNSAKDVKPVMDELKRTTRRLMPEGSTKLPRGLNEKLKAWAASAEGQGGSSVDPGEESIQLQLAQVFEAQAKEAQQDKKEAEVKNTLKSALDQARHKDIYSQLDSIRLSNLRLASYQDKITANYQRKSLELQFRHYNVALESLVEQKKSAEETRVSLANIIKNTGLPEYAKLQNSERFKDFARNKFMNGISDTLFDKRRGYLRGVTGKISNAIQGKVRDVANSFSDTLSAVNMMADQHEMLASMGGGMSKAEMLGQLGGSIAADNVGSWLGKKAGIALNRSKYGKDVRRIGTDLEHYVENLPQYGDHFAKSTTGNDLPIIGGLVELLKETMHIDGVDNSLQRDSISSMQEPGLFTNQARKSITEVIPGLLARIHQELSIIRTGDEGAPMLAYDYANNKFTTAGDLHSNTLKSMFNSRTKERHQYDIDEAMSVVDPEGKLNKRDRKILAKHLTESNSRNILGDPTYFANADNYGGMDRKQAEKFANHFKGQFEIDEDGKLKKNEVASQRRLNFSRVYNRLGSSSEDIRGQLQQLMNLGYHDILTQSGLVDKDGNINDDAVRDYASGQKALTEIKSSVPRGTGGFRQVSSDIQSIIDANTIHDKPSDDKNESLEVLGKILEEIKRSNTVEINRSINAVTARIEAILLESNFGGGGQGGMSNNDRKRWYQMTAGDMLDAAGGFLKNAAAGARKQFSRGMGMLRTAGGIVSQKAGQAFDWLTGKYNEITDVYLKGELKPRLEAWKIKAGHYIDETTGKVISKLSDIKGTIVDVDGNIVIDKEQLKDIVINTKSRLGSVLSKVKELGMKAFGNAKTFYGKSIALATTAFTMAKNKLIQFRDRPQDVYVIGETTPRLLAITMSAGGYFSKVTAGKVIKKPSDIDGPVMDQDGNVLLTDADIKKGLVNKNGTPFESLLGKINRLGRKVIDTAMMLGKQAFGKVRDIVKGGWGKVKGFFKGGINLGGMTADGMIVYRLTEIRDLLNDRLPGGKKVFGDIDGDGIREGSWQDKAKKAADSAKEKILGEKRLDGTREGGLLGKLTGAFGGLTDMLKKKFGKKDEEDDDDGLGIGVDVDLPDGKGKSKVPGTKPKGRFGRLMDGGKNLGKRALGYLGRGWNGLKGIGAGLAGRFAGTGIGQKIAGSGMMNGIRALGGRLAGRLALGGAAAAGAGALAGAGGILGTLGTALGALVSWPVTLGALALTGGYYAYKHFTAKSLDTLSTYRYAQYGFNANDKDYLEQVFGLEDRLMPAITEGIKGPDIDEGKVEMKDILDSFGIGEDDEARGSEWAKWFTQRFKPVFLTHIAALKNVNPKVTLDKVDSKLNADEKLRYFQKSRFPDGPYSVVASPVAGLKNLVITKFEVDKVAEVTEAKLKEKAKEDPKKMDLATKTSALATAATVSSQLPGDADGGTVKGVESVLDANKAMTGSEAIVAQQGGGDSLTVTSSLAAFDVAREKMVSPINAVRYRTYGLMDLETAKVNSILALESAVLKDVVVEKGKGVTWTGSITRIIGLVGAQFGVPSINTDEGENFLVWFNGRFLPTFLNYISAINNVTGKSDPSVVTGLSASELLTIANAVYTTQTSFEGRSGVSVWDVYVSPWKGYKLNTNKETAQDTVQAIVDESKNEVLKEKVPTKTNNELTKSDVSEKAKAENKSGGFWDNVKSKFSNAASYIGGGIKAGFSAMGDFGNRAITTAKDYAGKAINAMGFGVRTDIQGTGGKLDEVPMPTGNSTWSALKDTILHAAKVVGVDESLMAVMAAIESGFNYTVKAGTSSATGLYQFIKSTWDSMVRKYGAKYGIGPNTPPTDPRANALLGAEFLKENIKEISPVLDRPPSQTDLYLAHFLGPAGARRFLKADPNAIAAQILPDAAKANRPIFYNPDGTPKTVSQIYSDFSNKIAKKAQTFGLPVASTELPNAGKQSAVASNDASVGLDNGGGLSTAAPVQSKTAEMLAKDSRNPNIVQASATAVPSTVSPVQPGFNMARQNVDTQVKATQQDFNNSIGVIDNTLKQSLAVQQSQLAVLEKILSAIGNSAPANVQPAGPVKASADENAMPARNVPVRMFKQA